MPEHTWPERPRWVVVVVDRPGVWHYAGQYPTRAIAAVQARRLRQTVARKVFVERSGF